MLGLERVTMQDLTETTILKEGTVKITNLRAIFGTKTYEIANITSASIKVRDPNLFMPVLFAVYLGICLVLVAISNREEYGHWLQIGLYVGTAAFVMFVISRKTKYTVQIKNPVSELDVLETGDRNYAERVVKAVNDSIANLEA